MKKVLFATTALIATASMAAAATRMSRMPADASLTKSARTGAKTRRKAEGRSVISGMLSFAKLSALQVLKVAGIEKGGG